MRITKMDAEHLLLWCRQAKDKAAEVGVPFEEDELALEEKIRITLHPAEPKEAMR